MVNVDGRLAGERDAVVSVFDHGFLFGEGVYEVMRTYRQRPFLYEPHMRRLRASADRIALPLPATDAEIREFCREQIAHYKVPRYIRFVDDMPMTITGKVQKFVMRDQMIEELKLTEARTA